MSGIYIPDVNLPGEDDLWIVIGKDGSFTYNVREGKGWQDGKQKAVPVPPHGRLIDADALEKEAQKRMLICNKNDNQFQKPYEIMRAIACAPTIIPAEPKEEAT